MTEYFSARPYTQAERDRDINARKQVDERTHNRRRTLRSGQRYDKPGTPALREQYDRVGGK